MDFYNRFQIGDWVHTDRTVRPAITADNMRKLQALPVPCDGVIVGLKRFHLGQLKIRWEQESWEMPRYDAGSYLDISETVVVWAIKTGMFNKPIYARDSDVVPAVVGVKTKLPLLFTRQPPWTDDAKEDMRTEASRWPRDAKGRWIKEKQKESTDE